MSINVSYFTRESIQNFRRNWVMSFGAVITIYLSLLLVGVFLVFGVLVNSVVQSVESKVSIQVFLKDGAPTADVNALQRSLLDDALVKSVDYTSKSEALERFKKEMKQSPEIVNNLDRNPLPASLDVTLKDPRTVETMVAKIKAQALFTKVADRPDNPEESLKYGQQVVRQAVRVHASGSRHRRCVRDHAGDRVADLHQQHDPYRDLRAPQRDRHHAPGRCEQLVHPNPVPSGGRAAGNSWRGLCDSDDHRPRGPDPAEAR